MRSLIGQLVVQLLAALLVLTTPIGTGEGPHQSELLHPVLPHVHTINGQIVSDRQLRAERVAAEPLRAATEPTGGTALGAGTGAEAAGLGIALGPTMPAIDDALRASNESDSQVLDAASVLSRQAC